MKQMKSLNKIKEKAERMNEKKNTNAKTVNKVEMKYTNKPMKWKEIK